MEPIPAPELTILSSRPEPEKVATEPSLLSFLGLPAELRTRIYVALFCNLTLIPAFTNPQTTSLAHRRFSSSLPTTPSNTNDVDPSAFAGSDSESDSDSSSSERPAQHLRLANLSILLTSRKIHNESLPVLLRNATFSVSTNKQHVLFTQPHMLPSLDQIRHLSVPFSLLPEWSPTLLRLVTRSLSSFEIRDIRVSFGHTDMLAIEAQLPSSGPQRGMVAPPSRTPGLALFQAVVAEMDESKAELILAHFGECMTRDMLTLHFKIQCLHAGQIVVPGMFPMVNAPHEHTAKEFMYAFGAKHLLGVNPS